ncbi:hypothetical protein ABRP86_08060 [Corynebacterium sp. KPL3927]|uniref:hypothetical protein n=2 Tax=unclassified Corynebacterium TaxID=2624378 RepID=UPI0032EE9B86
MSQLLNSRNNMVKQHSARPQIVPSAAIWDIDDRSWGGQHPRSEIGKIRTLDSEYRTNPKEHSNMWTDEYSFSNVANKAVEEDDAHSSRKNYLLGAVFGAAVFFGTVVGGLMGTNAETPTGPGASVQQVEAAIVQ